MGYGSTASRQVRQLRFRQMRRTNLPAGAIQTPLLRRLEGEKRAVLDYYRNGAPLHRLGVPEDLTPMVCYLLSDAAAFTTGADFLVTGESEKVER